METKTVDLPTDQLLLTLQAGDITAFEMIFKTYYQPLCNYAYSFVHDRDEAEEIVQATFLSVWEKKRQPYHPHRREALPLRHGTKCRS